MVVRPSGETRKIDASGDWVGHGYYRTAAASEVHQLHRDWFAKRNLAIRSWVQFVALNAGAVEVAEEAAINTGRDCRRGAGKRVHRGSNDCPHHQDLEFLHRSPFFREVLLGALVANSAQLLSPLTYGHQFSWWSRSAHTLTPMRTFATRLARVLGPDPGAVAQSGVALLISVVATLVAGLTLASAEGRLEELPGLLLLVPAAIAQRGNVFGALGSRLGTAIHTGEFSITRRLDTVFGQNVLASLGLSVMAAAWLGLVAWVLSKVFRIEDAMGVFDFLTISVVGGVAASVVVFGLTVALAAGSRRFGWDLDNVISPLVTGTGDLVTLPALLAASLIVGSRVDGATNDAAVVVGAAVLIVAVVTFAISVRRSLPLLRRIVIESLPVLGLASFVSLIAGIVVENQLGRFLDQPALLVLVPAYFGMAGALGGILSSRLGSKVHLGLIQSRLVPQREALLDIRSVAVLAVPIFIIVGLSAHLGSQAVGAASPGLGSMVAVALLAGIGATLVVLAVAYYGTLAAVRLGLDPDTATIPLTNSVLDLVGAFTLVGAIILLGVGT